MAKYFLTPKAQEDLFRIWDYTYEVWSERQADKYYEILIEALKKISSKPSLGKNYQEVHPDTLGCHVGKHIIFYKPISTTEIKILRILHERMDLTQQDLE